MKSYISLLFILCVIFNKNIIKCTTGSESGSGGGSPAGSAGVSENGSRGQRSATSPEQGEEQSPSGGSVQRQEQGAGQSSNEVSGDASVQKTVTSSVTPSPTTPSENKNSILVKSALLKDYMGVKVTGPCNENFVMFLVPHIYIEVDTEDTYIELRTSLRETDNFLLFESNSGSLEKKKYVKEESEGTNGEKNPSTGTVEAQDESGPTTRVDSSESSSSRSDSSGRSNSGTGSSGSSGSGNSNNGQAVSSNDSNQNNRNLHNICATGKTFKFVVYIKENTLILKWKVYGKEENNQVDVRKYMINEKESPITSILIHSYKEHNETNLIESKNYVLRSDVPEKCDALASNCFLSGNFNIEKCFQCALLVEPEKNKDECFKYLSEDIRNKFTEIKAETEDDDEDDYTEYKLTESIDNI
ncbi:serine repeat antigen 5, putative [Plasmodium sp. gorilla clade G2]|nr:serine repeat antigen 5, putative [Plasmodium sp. gorilla clade G2]SOV20361.1 serine repeat antigen 5, putative [Plasmodium sp. gorilla clade G2]